MHAPRAHGNAVTARERAHMLGRAGGAQVNYFAFVAEEVRAGLAALGMRSLDELVGRADLLRQRDIQLAKTSGLDLSYITAFAGAVRPSSERAKQEVGPAQLTRPLTRSARRPPLHAAQSVYAGESMTEGPAEQSAAKCGLVLHGVGMRPITSCLRTGRCRRLPVRWAPSSAPRPPLPNSPPSSSII